MVALCCWGMQLQVARCLVCAGLRMGSARRLVSGGFKAALGAVFLGSAIGDCQTPWNCRFLADGGAVFLGNALADCCTPGGAGLPMMALRYWGMKDSKEFNREEKRK